MSRSSSAAETSGSEPASTATAGADGKATGSPAAKSVAGKATPAKGTAAKAAAKAPAKAATKAAPTPSRAAARTGSKAAVKAKPAAPSDDPGFAAFLLEIEAQLLDERAVYIEQADLLKAEADLLAADREPGDVQFDEESGEGDTLAVERERDLALSAQARGAVNEIDSALAKIGAGTYGICEQCGHPIPQERLRAIPFASLCVQCKSMGLGRR
jgi:RNA polymerase-binding transcription factor DksA